MKFAIIAAGEGSRLQQEGINVPKPLVRLHGEPLIDRLVRIFTACGADEIDIIVNDIYPELAAHVSALTDAAGSAPVNMLVKTTPSSMHSFFELSRLLGDGQPFCLTTVDTIFRESEFAAFVNAFKQSALDGMMAVTDYIDDEKPLYVGTDAHMMITGFHDADEGDKYISGGIYCLKPNALDTLQACMARGESRMRNFQRALIADGRRLQACAFSKILDVDHASDIAKAEAFLQND